MRLRPTDQPTDRLTNQPTTDDKKMLGENILIRKKSLMAMCDELADHHTGRCLPLLSNLHSFTPYCDIGPASEDISCS
ncbi:hypothetical protein THAOC_08172, partial [Thalassiosira oceanica]